MSTDDVTRAWFAYQDARMGAGLPPDILTKIGALHAPFRIYDECGHDHRSDDVGVIDTGEFLTCEEGYQYSICHNCCIDNPDWPEQGERCADGHRHGKDRPICRTIGILIGEE